jgi:hypothetical protein
MAAITSTMPKQKTLSSQSKNTSTALWTAAKSQPASYVDGERFAKSIGTKKHSKTPTGTSNTTFARNTAKLSIRCPNSPHAFGKGSFMCLMSLSKIGRTRSKAAIQAPKTCLPLC